MHALIDIRELAEVGGPLALVLAAIFGFGNASGEKEGKGEKFLNGALLGAVVGVVLAVLYAAN